MARYEEEVEERFWQKVDPMRDGCWLWFGTVLSNGYGQFIVGKRPKRRTPPHRYAYELLVGPIPDDRPELDHLCRNPRCVNPDHLEPVTRWENLRRAPNSSVWRRLRHDSCVYGHDPSRYVTRDDGFRHCLECHRLREQTRRAQRRTAKGASDR